MAAITGRSGGGETDAAEVDGKTGATTLCCDGCGVTEGETCAAASTGAGWSSCSTLALCRTRATYICLIQSNAAHSCSFICNMIFKVDDLHEYKTLKRRHCGIRIDNIHPHN